VSEQGTTKAMSLGQLKNRIAHYERKLKADSTDELYAERRYDALALAWRAAFEWRNGMTGIPTDEFKEGMALIREKLQS
jgi:hypothetical protein